MTVRILLFAILRDAAGVPGLSVDLPDAATAQFAAASLVDRFPLIQPYLHRIAYAINQQYAPALTALHDGDELALIPPVSGG
jgi:molybdopterin converting factor subunit 1